MSYFVNKVVSNPWNTKYFTHVRGVQQVQGLTAGLNYGHSPDNSRQYAPYIHATMPEPVAIHFQQPHYTNYAMVPSRPFYHDKHGEVNDSFGNGFTQIQENTNPYILPILAILLFAMMMQYRNR